MLRAVGSGKSWPEQQRAGRESSPPADRRGSPPAERHEPPGSVLESGRGPATGSCRMRASSWDTLVSCLAASIRAQRATASSRVMVMFLNRRMTRLQCYTDFVSPGSSGSPTSPQELPTIRLGDNGNTAASVAFSPDPGQRFLYVASRSPARIWVFDRKTRWLPVRT